MSHFSRLATHFVSMEHLAKALKDVGFGNVEIHEAPQKLAGFFGFKSGKTAEVIIRKETANMNADAGFKKNADGRLELIVVAEDRSRFERLMGRLRQRYSYHVALDTLRKQGFAVASEAVENDQSLRLVLRRMA